MNTQEFGEVCLFTCKCRTQAEHAYYLARILKSKHNRALMQEFKDTAVMLKEAGERLLELAKIQTGNVSKEKEKAHEQVGDNRESDQGPGA